MLPLPVPIINHQNPHENDVLKIFDSLIKKIQKRGTKGDKASLQKAYIKYKQFYESGLLNVDYLDFHYHNITLGNVPEYIVPIIYQQIKIQDPYIQDMHREETRDSDILKLSGCLYYSQVYSHIKFFSFIKRRVLKSRTEEPHFNQQVLEELKTSLSQIWIKDDELTDITIKQRSVDIANQVFQTIEDVSCVCTFQYKNVVHILLFTYIQKVDSRNKKHQFVTEITFDEETPFKPIPLLGERIVQPHIFPESHVNKELGSHGENGLEVKEEMPEWDFIAVINSSFPESIDSDQDNFFFESDMIQFSINDSD